MARSTNSKKDDKPRKEDVATSVAEALYRAAAVVPAAADVVEATFDEDASVRAVFSEHLSARTEQAIPNAVRARKAFAEFRPSLFTAREREREGEGETPNYLNPGEDLATTLESVVEKGVARLRERSDRNGLRVQLTDSLRHRIFDDEGDQKTIGLDDLLGLLATRLPTQPTRREDPAFTACAAKVAAQSRLDQIEGVAAGSPEEGSAEPPTGDPPGTPTATDDETEAEEGVAPQVRRLIAHVPSPEEAPVLVAPVAADHGQVMRNIETFELRAGPSDVTSYHDFSSLQVAFEHVWEEVFDGRLGEVGREFYHAYVDLLDFLGNPVDPTTGKPLSPPASVTSIDDIVALLQDASMLGRVATAATPSLGVPADVLTGYGYARQNLVRGFQLYDPTDFPTADVAEAFVDGSMAPLRQKIDLANQQAAQNAALASTLPAVERLQTLLKRMRDLLSTPYSFTVFREKTCNFGICVTYRQSWRPEQYQVGDLVSTIPLTPRETRRYTTKQVTKRSRAVKEVANNLSSVRTDIDTTGRADHEIVSRAENRTNFKVTADGTYGVEGEKIHATAEGGGDSAKISQDTKKDFHEAVLKSAREYKQDNRMEVDTNSSEESETTTFHEIQNPNDELTVTYLFYELQRTYRLSEQIHQVTPVVLVANKVPAPHEIDDAWLVTYDWILRRVLLDDSFRPALDYLTKSFVGDELTLQLLDNNVKAQRQVVDAVKAQVAAALSVAEAAQRDLSTKMDAKGGLQFAEGFLGTVKNIFDPLHLTGQSATGLTEGADAVASYAEETLDRAEKEKARALDQLGMATTALQVAVDKLAAATKEHYDKVAEIDRLRLHVKENVLYYMQAIWSHEPPDQRYFRIFETQVPVPVPKDTNVDLPVAGPSTPLIDALRQRDSARVTLPMPEVDVVWQSLVEIADLDTVLGYKGNYAIYPLKENNYLTLHMMQDYLELSDEVQVSDPDDFANYTVDQLQELATCLYNTDKDEYRKRKGDIRQWMIDRLASGRPEDDRVIVPTSSLYLEALVGTHPLLEDFKLLHRALDVKKAQAEVRHAELENIRVAARVLAGELGDPDVEKVIVVEGPGTPIVLDPGD